jgi:hypothetical protein
MKKPRLKELIVIKNKKQIKECWEFRINVSLHAVWCFNNKNSRMSPELRPRIGSPCTNIGVAVCVFHRTYQYETWFNGSVSSACILTGCIEMLTFINIVCKTNSLPVTVLFQLNRFIVPLNLPMFKKNLFFILKNKKNFRLNNTKKKKKTRFK